MIGIFNFSPSTEIMGKNEQNANSPQESHNHHIKAFGELPGKKIHPSCRLQKWTNVHFPNVQVG